MLARLRDLWRRIRNRLLELFEEDNYLPRGTKAQREYFAFGCRTYPEAMDYIGRWSLARRRAEQLAREQLPPRQAIALAKESFGKKWGRKLKTIVEE